MSDKTETTTTDPLATIAEALLEINDTLESILTMMQEREEGFKARKAAFSGDRRPRSYGDRDGNSDGGYERKPYRPSGDRPSYGGERKSYGDKPSYGGERKSYGDKKPYAPRGRSGGDDAPAPRKKYKDGY